MRNISDLPTSAPVSRSYEVASVVDDVADAFEAEWKSGSTPELEHYVARLPAAVRSQAVGELIFLDIEYRKRRGDATELQSYRDRFPDWLPEDEPPACPAEASAGLAELDRVGRYVVVSALAREGQGEVYRAVHPLGRQVVLKFLRPDLAATAGELITMEAKALAQLDHPNIAAVVDLDVHAGRPFLAVAYVHGMTLDRYAAAHTLTPMRIARLCGKVARAVAAAHRVGVAHLDLKPRNVVIDTAGEPHVIDFGAARVNGTATEPNQADAPMIGTVPYMSPEQADADPSRVGPRSDLFGVGALLYYLLTGTPPADGPTREVALARAKAGQYKPLPASAPAALAGVCLRAMAKDPDDRPDDADALADMLERVADPPRRRWPWAAAAAVAALVVSLGAGLYLSRPVPATAVPESTVSMDVWRGPDRGWTPALGATLHLSDSLRVSLTAAPGTFASLFLIDNDGVVQCLTTVPADRPDRLAVFPAGDQGMSFHGTAGNCAVVALSRRDRAVTHDELRRLLGSDVWPRTPMPTGTYLSVTRDSLNVHADTATRDMRVVPVPASDAMRAVLDRLRHQAVAGDYGLTVAAAPLSPDTP